MKELIKAGDSVTIKDNTVKVIEYKGHRVLSSYTIAQLHGREVKRANEQFERNKTRLQEGVDYFLIGREEFEVADSDHKISSKAFHRKRLSQASQILYRRSLLGSSRLACR